MTKLFSLPLLFSQGGATVFLFDGAFRFSQFVFSYLTFGRGSAHALHPCQKSFQLIQINRSVVDGMKE
jgi:hypothetical protein